MGTLPPRAPEKKRRAACGGGGGVAPFFPAPQCGWAAGGGPTETHMVCVLRLMLCALAQEMGAWGRLRAHAQRRADEHKKGSFSAPSLSPAHPPLGRPRPLSTLTRHAQAQQSQPEQQPCCSPGGERESPHCGVDEKGETELRVCKKTEPGSGSGPSRSHVSIRGERKKPRPLCHRHQHEKKRKSGACCFLTHAHQQISPPRPLCTPSPRVPLDLLALQQCPRARRPHGPPRGHDRRIPQVRLEERPPQPGRVDGQGRRVGGGKGGGAPARPVSHVATSTRPSGRHIIMMAVPFASLRPPKKDEKAVREAPSPTRRTRSPIAASSAS